MLREHFDTLSMPPQQDTLVRLPAFQAEAGMCRLEAL